tara:strand:- start:40 stop:609 length:570 start_codon:yes stop_codon:yes gene_type:complete
MYKTKDLKFGDTIFITKPIFNRKCNNNMKCPMGIIIDSRNIRYYGNRVLVVNKNDRRGTCSIIKTDCNIKSYMNDMMMDYDDDDIILNTYLPCENEKERNGIIRNMELFVGYGIYRDDDEDGKSIYYEPIDIGVNPMLPTFKKDGENEKINLCFTHIEYVEEPDKIEKPKCRNLINAIKSLHDRMYADD